MTVPKRLLLHACAVVLGVGAIGGVQTTSHAICWNDQKCSDGPFPQNCYGNSKTKGYWCAINSEDDCIDDKGTCEI
jgi:hypothetical protein